MRQRSREVNGRIRFRRDLLTILILVAYPVSPGFNSPPSTPAVLITEDDDWERFRLGEPPLIVELPHQPTKRIVELQGNLAVEKRAPEYHCDADGINWVGSYFTLKKSSGISAELMTRASLTKYLKDRGATVVSQRFWNGTENGVSHSLCQARFKIKGKPYAMGIQCFLKGNKFWRVMAVLLKTNRQTTLDSYRMVAKASF